MSQYWEKIRIENEQLLLTGKIS